MENTSLAERVLGIADPGQPDALYTAYTNITNPDITKEDFEAQCAKLDKIRTDAEKAGPDGWDSVAPKAEELIVTLGTLREICDRQHIRWANVLQDWPHYQEAYRPQPDNPSESRWALQLGCLTGLSAAAFAGLAKDVYHARPITIDMSASLWRARHGGYAFSDASHNPGIRSETMNVVQSDRLLHTLLSPHEINGRKASQKLLSEVRRVLKPGGQLIMREIAPNLDAREHPHFTSEKSQKWIAFFRDCLGQDLVDAGFEDVQLTPATEIIGSDYLFDRSRNFAGYKTRPRAATFSISAFKPAQ